MLPKIEMTKNIVIFFIVILFTWIGLLVFSIYFTSSILAILALAIGIWSPILLYAKPSKVVSISLLNAVASSEISIIEKLILDNNLEKKGKYLPPRLIGDFDSSKVLITSATDHPICLEDNVFGTNKNLVMTPPGFGLSKLIEKEIGRSFSKVDINFLKNNLPKILVEKMELAKSAQLNIQNNTLILELKGNIFAEVCRETTKYPLTHKNLGCIFSSAIACIFAKASGNIITIVKDELLNHDISRFEFYISEE